MTFTQEQRKFIVEVYIRSKSYDETQKAFQEKFGYEAFVPHKSTIKRLYDKFQETGNLSDLPRSGRPSLLTEDRLTDIAAAIADSPQSSLRRLSNQSGLSFGSVRNALRANGMRPYKIRMVQNLLPSDPAARVQYCQWLMTMISPDQDELNDWFWSDEAWFHLDGYVNSQNSRMWATENLHHLHEERLHAQKLGVWCAMSRCKIFVVFFNETVNSVRYIEMVNQFVGSLSEEELNKAWFQQDNAPAHTADVTLDHLNRVFSGRLISKGLWPPRSPDLSPLDFYLWGYLKQVAYNNHPRTIQQLQQCIQTCIEEIPTATLKVVFRNMMNRVSVCEGQNGAHFEHLL